MMISSQPNPIHFSEGFFTSSLPVLVYFNQFISKICLLSTVHPRYGMMLFIMSHLLVKEAISFSILFTFRISAMRLFKFMNFFSLDINTYILNISRI